MKPLLVSIAALLLAGAAQGQPVPTGSGVLAFKEKLKIAGGCEGFSDADTLSLVVLPNATWTADTPGGDFSGTMAAADPDAREWNLTFDGSSLTAYELYLEDLAGGLCGTAVSISNLQISLELKLGKDGAQASVQLKTTATGSTAFGSGTGKHQLKGKGAFTQPVALPGSGASVVVQSFPWYEAP